MTATFSVTASGTAPLTYQWRTVGTPGHSSVLYIPAGTYSINQTLVMASKNGISILGDDPSTVTIRWNGPAATAGSYNTTDSTGTMLLTEDTYFDRIGRITWDGNGKARTAFWHRGVPTDTGQSFSSGFEHADEVLRASKPRCRRRKRHRT